MLTFTDPQVLGGDEVSICIFRKQNKTLPFLPECRREWSFYSHCVLREEVKFDSGLVSDVMGRKSFLWL